jgi:patatin-like phospholipase/acyl hydrolase
MTYRILSLDGGGIRGVFTAALLERLEGETRFNFNQQVDLFAGTSTGGILALGLASGMTPKKCKELYQSLGQEIFTSSPLGKLDDFFFAKYSNVKLRQRLEAVFRAQGVETLGDLPKKVLIPTFDLRAKPDGQGGNGVNNRHSIETWKPKFFHNLDEPGSDVHQSVVDVALATSAAPSFFPSSRTYVDGGVMANNPSMCAVAQALKAGVALDEITLLSLGTGLNPKFLPGENLNWGSLRWVHFKTLIPALSSKVRAGSVNRAFSPSDAFITELLVEGTLDVAQYQCRQILKERFHRLNPLLQINGEVVRIDLDDAHKIEDLLLIAQSANLMDDDAGSSVSTTGWLKNYFSIPPYHYARPMLKYEPVPALTVGA